MAQSNGGVSQTSRVTLYPMLNAQTGIVSFFSFDPNNGYNDPAASSFYTFKVEEVIQGRTPTISRVVVSYRDLGQVSAVFTLTGTNDAQQVVGGLTGNGSMQVVQLGNALPTGKIMTVLIGISLTAQNIQLMVTRAAGAGPLSITKILMCGRVENAELG